MESEKWLLASQTIATKSSPGPLARAESEVIAPTGDVRGKHRVEIHELFVPFSRPEPADKTESNLQSVDPYTPNLTAFHRAGLPPKGRWTHPARILC